MKEKIKSLIAEMTLEEKAALCSGADFWHMQGVERLGIPSVMVTDGPHGLRKQAEDADHLGLNASAKATCFPPAATAASSWNRDMLYAEGEAVGEECIQEEVAVILGPGANIKRSPLCGRNFEYFSEDPFLAGEMAAGWVKGVQSKGIGTSLKHFAANNQEKARLVSNSVVDERALREIYLAPFEKTVKEAQPWTLMGSYNQINGTYSCENSWLLHDVLREEWGFEGLVMTDWGAMNNRVEALKAGLELEMPGPSHHNNKKIVNAVREGILKEEILDQAVERLLTLILKAQQVQQKPYYVEKHHRQAEVIAADSMVLLKNEGMLPLDKEKSYAVIGAFAKTPRYQGAGSSKINPHRIDVPYEALANMGIEISYAEGYELNTDKVNEALIQEAVSCAREKDGVIVFAGLPDSYESEGYDRRHLNMPESHNALIEALAEVNSHITVVLMCGSAVLMPWRDKAESILLAYLGGEAVGSACADILTGAVNPSGKLAETFPLTLEDTPCFAHFAKEDMNIEYRESIFVGYRYYDWAKKEVAYPFGYGISYTSFSYEGMKVEWDDIKEQGSVSVKISNTGNAAGSEIIQLYIGKSDSNIMRAPKELKGFSKVFLNPGESKIVEIPLEKRSFAFYDVEVQKWIVEDGVYQLFCAASSRDIRQTAEVSCKGKILKKNIPYLSEQVIQKGMFAGTQEVFAGLFKNGLPLLEKSDKLTVNTTIREVMENEKWKAIFEPLIKSYTSFHQGDDDISIMMMAMLYDMPLRNLAMFGGTGLDVIENMIAEV